MEVGRKDGLKFIIYSNDHTPAHVHVENADGKVKINLGDEDERPEVVSIKGKIKNRDLLKALQICCEKQQEFLEKWRGIHG